MALLAMFVGLLSMLRAHDPGISTAQGLLLGDRLLLTHGFAPADAELLLPDTIRAPGTWTETEFEAARARLEALAPQLWEARAGTSLLPVQVARVELAAGDALNFHLEFPRPDAPALVLIARKLGELPPGHREFVMIADEHGSTITKKLLSARDNTLEVPLAAAPTAEDTGQLSSPTFRGFFILGVEHIWTGYDHILFLLALLVVSRSFRSSVAIISCFTLAHSLTLALSTLDFVQLPNALVEPLIAASIIVVGVENLWRRGAEPRGRWVLTFAFGLIHGFGFASVLRDIGLGRGGEGVAMPLFSFNLGVEVGQIAIAAIVLPLLWQASKQEKFIRLAVPALSALVAFAGFCWLLDRTLLA